MVLLARVRQKVFNAPRLAGNFGEAQNAAYPGPTMRDPLGPVEIEALRQRVQQLTALFFAIYQEVGPQFRQQVVIIARLEGRLSDLSRPQVQFNRSRKRASIERFRDQSAATRPLGFFFIAWNKVGSDGHHNDVARGGIRFQTARQFETVVARQLHVHQNQPRPELGEHCQGFRSVACCADFVALRRQYGAHQFQVHRVVVDDKNWISTHKGYTSPHSVKV